MTQTKIQKGDAAVFRVIENLEAQGHMMILQSFRFKKDWQGQGRGECDLVSWDPMTQELWLVEVKYRPLREWALPLISPKQLQRLRASFKSLGPSLVKDGRLRRLKLSKTRFFLAWVKSLNPSDIEFLENP